MNHETPEWARDAVSKKVISIDAGTFDEPAPPAPKPSLSHNELREAAISRSKQPNASPYSFDYPPTHWHSYTGEGSSTFDFDVLAAIGRTIAEPRFKRIFVESLDSHDAIPKDGKYVRINGYYNPRIACWVEKDSSTVNLSDLWQAVDDRIEELGLDYERLYAWTVQPCPTDDEKLFYSLSFDERMARFKTEEK